MMWFGLTTTAYLIFLRAYQTESQDTTCLCYKQTHAILTMYNTLA